LPVANSILPQIFPFFFLEQSGDVSKSSQSHCPPKYRMERKILFDILVSRAQEYPEMGRAISRLQRL
jgi:hypothetical protein